MLVDRGTEAERWVTTSPKRPGIRRRETRFMDTEITEIKQSWWKLAMGSNYRYNRVCTRSSKMDGEESGLCWREGNLTKYQWRLGRVFKWKCPQVGGRAELHLWKKFIDINKNLRGHRRERQLRGRKHYREGAEKWKESDWWTFNPWNNLSEESMDEEEHLKYGTGVVTARRRSMGRQARSVTSILAVNGGVLH